MFERVGIEKKIGANMKDDEELEKLLGEIPHATSFNLHHPHSNGHHNVHGDHCTGSFVSQKMNGVMYGLYDDDPMSHKYTCASPVSGFSLQSDGSSSSLLSGGHSLSDNGSPPPPPPPLEELKSQMFCGSSNSSSGLLLDLQTPDCVSSVAKKANVTMIDELILSKNLSRMYISKEQGDVSVDSNGYQFCDRYVGGTGTNQLDFEKYRSSHNRMQGLSDYGGVQSSVPRSPLGFNDRMNSELLSLQHEYRILGSLYSPVRSDGLFSQLNYSNSHMGSQYQRAEEVGNYYHKGVSVSDLAASVNRSSIVGDLYYGQKNEMNLIEGQTAFHPLNMPQFTQSRPHFNVKNMLHCHPALLNGRTRASSSVKIPQGALDAVIREDSLIIQGEGVNYGINKGNARSRGQNNRGSLHDISVGNSQEKRSQLNAHPQFAGTNQSVLSARTYCPFSLAPKCNSVAEAQGYIYLIAKDQHGCRFLQRMFDEGSPQDVQIIFNEIIGHVVELMINPFGNYLMQKLLEVCNEEQRMQILLRITVERGELVRISLNTHGTRVVQKLIETLKTRQQISLAISALEPGFIALIKDLNGNHVVQRCLQCLSDEDNKYEPQMLWVTFIFVAAAKYCIDIATHQHGCCVLQRCISRSTGEYRENLVTEISANGLLLSEDAFGCLDCSSLWRVEAFSFQL
ncbi:unnamed protein product [Ilex paraguariensis]|uniref:PUM-HD domain-containing protein n=1 Tax=Ilex paraguariensis TaxID=185542 RepID=A0ABC8TAV4_9AQUA